MSGYQDYEVPVGIDAPIPIFKWEVVEIVIAIVILGCGIVLRQFHFGIIGAYLVLHFAKKLRAGQKRGQVQHLLWRFGLNLDGPLKKHAPSPIKLEYMK